MSQFMTHLLYSSFSAAILIVAVLLVRLLVTKKAPRWVACVLWGLVGVRLLVPFSIESELSILPEIELSVSESQSEGEVSEQSKDHTVEESAGESITESVDVSESASAGESSHVSDENSKDTTSESSDEESEPSVVPPPLVGDTSDEPSNDEASNAESSVESMETSTEDSAEESAEVSVSESMPTSDAGGESTGSADEQSVADRTGVVGLLWTCGMGALLLYAVVQYLLLRRRVAVFSVGENGIRRCEQIDTPFVLGFFRPRIYLPFGLTEEVETYIIAHEQAHIRRFDHVTKVIAFAALALHWFNPFVWLAFVLFCRDIEYACDEKVVRNLSGEERKAYASALLSASVRK